MRGGQRRRKPDQPLPSPQLPCDRLPLRPCRRWMRPRGSSTRRVGSSRAGRTRRPSSPLAPSSTSESGGESEGERGSQRCNLIGSLQPACTGRLSWRLREEAEQGRASTGMPAAGTGGGARRPAAASSTSSASLLPPLSLSFSPPAACATWASSGCGSREWPLSCGANRAAVPAPLWPTGHAHAARCMAPAALLLLRLLSRCTSCRRSS